MIVLAFANEESLADRMARSLADAWPAQASGTTMQGGDAAPAFTIASAESQTIDDVDRYDAAVLVVDHSQPDSKILRLLTSFEEASVPVLALVTKAPAANNPFTLAGALVADASENPQILGAVLHALAHRQREVRRLREEVAMAQRFQGGLNGEMAKIHDELRLAALVQREMLPHHLPQVHGVEVAALWRPVNYVSGDIYEIVRLDEDHIGIFLADAVGHGVPAALMTMVLCHSLRPKEITGRSHCLKPPAEVLAQLNADMIERQGGHTRFATAVYCLLDCRRRVLTLAGAGHPPPLVIRADGSCDELVTEGGLLGVFENETYNQIEVELTLEDRLLFFSDGFEQAFPNPGKDAADFHVPTMRYRQEFIGLAGLKSAQDMIEALCMRIDGEQGSLHQVDDLTLICVHAGPIVPTPIIAADHARPLAA